MLRNEHEMLEFETVENAISSMSMVAAKPKKWFECSYCSEVIGDFSFSEPVAHSTVCAAFCLSSSETIRFMKCQETIESALKSAGYEDGFSDLGHLISVAIGFGFGLPFLNQNLVLQGAKSALAIHGKKSKKDKFLLNLFEKNPDLAMYSLFKKARSTFCERTGLFPGHSGIYLGEPHNDLERPPYNFYYGTLAAEGKAVFDFYLG